MPSISSGVSGGRMDGSRAASMDLPDPGAPTISMLCTIDPKARDNHTYSRPAQAQEQAAEGRPMDENGRRSPEGASPLAPGAAAIKAYSYLRFSTPDQMKGDSLRRQTELARRYAVQ